MGAFIIAVMLMGAGYSIGNHSFEKLVEVVSSSSTAAGGPTRLTALAAAVSIVAKELLFRVRLQNFGLPCCCLQGRTAGPEGRVAKEMDWFWCCEVDGPTRRDRSPRLDVSLSRAGCMTGNLCVAGKSAGHIPLVLTGGVLR